MKLDARFINIIYKIAEQDPPLTQEQQDIPEGALWLNEVTGKIFIALKHPEKKNKIVWLSLGGQEDYLAAGLGGSPNEKVSEISNAIISQFSTVNITDIFNDNSIVAFYPFDGNANDLANGYNGTWHGSESYAQGIFGQAARFDCGETGWVETSLVNPFKSDFTISLFYKPTKIIDSSSCGDTILAGLTDFKYGLMVRCWCKDNHYEVRWTIGDGSHWKDWPAIEKTQELNNPNKWFHIVIIKREHTYKFFINGVFRGSYTSSYPDYQGDEKMIIGTWGEYNNEHYCYDSHFLLDQFRIFNRALTPEEVLILYNENYLITKALKLLTHKLGGAKKEFIYIPGGDNIIKLEPNQPIDITGRAKIFKVTNPPPQVKESDYGKELYFPDNTAIVFTWDEDLTVPFTIFVKFKFDKINNDVYAQLMGLDFNGVPQDDKFDILVTIGQGKFGVNVGGHNTELGGWPPAHYIQIEPGSYNAFLTINSISLKLVVFDKELSRKQVSFTWDNNKPITKLRENKLALGAWIYTSDSGNRANKFDHFANSGLHIQAFRIFKGELSEEDMLTIAKEHTQKGVLLTEYLPQIKVYDTLDQKLEVFYNFNKIDATNKKIIDLSGKGRHGILKLANGEDIQEAFVPGVFGKALNCKDIDKRVTIQGLPTNVDFMTVCFWMYWTGEYNPKGDMPFGFNHFALWFKDNKFGFNTGKSDIYGINNALQKMSRKWVHICAVFPKQSTTNLANTGAELWINGKKQGIHYVQENLSGNRSITSTAYISGWGYSSDFPFHGFIDQFRIYSRKLTEKEIKLLARERYYFYK